MLTIYNILDIKLYFSSQTQLQKKHETINATVGIATHNTSDNFEMFKSIKQQSSQNSNKPISTNPISKYLVTPTEIIGK